MKKTFFLINSLIILVLVLSACNLPGTKGDSGVDIQTSVAQTVNAINYQTQIVPPAATSTEIPTEIPVATEVIPTEPVLPTATNTVVPSATTQPTLTKQPTATLVPTTAITIVPSVTAAPVPCNRADFLGDVTIPDGTSITAGNQFVKTWRLKNSGSCTWGAGYSLAFHSGTSMNGAASTALAATVAPGQTIDVSVTLQAPSTDGTYTGYWMLKNASGGFFGIGVNGDKAFWVKIVVGTTASVTTTAVSGKCSLVSQSPALYDSFPANASFDTRWKVKNTSGSTWNAASVDIKYVSGTKWFEGSTTSYDLPSDVADGGTYELILDSIAPATAGTYTMTWGIYSGSTSLCTLTSIIKVK
jgi:predicted small secreted protein